MASSGSILVTGGAGFIGSHCVEALLSRGWNVTVLDDFSTGTESNLSAAQQIAQKKSLQYRLLKKSIEDPETWAKLPRHDVVLHLAAKIPKVDTLKGSYSDWHQDFSSNVLFLRPLLDWVLRHKVKAFVSTSSAEAVYGHAQSFPTDERAALAPLDSYGATKAILSVYLTALTQSFRSSGTWSTDSKNANYFSWAILRLGHVFGPRQPSHSESGLVTTILKELSQGRAPVIRGNGNESRDYVFISDVVDCLMAAIDKVQVVALAEAFNASSGVETRHIDVFESIKRLMHEYGMDPESPKELQQSLKVSRPEFSPSTSTDVARLFLDCNKVEVFLAWKAKISLAEGLRQTIVQGFGLVEGR